MDGFLLLSAALTPFLLLGMFHDARGAVSSAYGVGYCIFFCFLAGPDNLTHYDPTGFINDAIALVLSMLVTSLAFAVLLPPIAPWLRNRLLIDLRRASRARPAARACTRTASRFESGTRDLISRSTRSRQTEPDAAARRVALAVRGARSRATR